MEKLTEDEIVKKVKEAAEVFNDALKEAAEYGLYPSGSIDTSYNWFEKPVLLRK